MILARAAGRAIMAVKDEGAVATHKADGSLVTLADSRAEAIILEGLAALSHGAPVLAEEEVAAGRTPTLGDFYFCVDPLDGTRDFVSGENGEFTVNIALIECGSPTLGVVYAPATGALYAGEPGRALRGDWDARGGDELSSTRAIQVADGASPWRVTASRRSGGPRTARFLEALGAVEERRASSSIKFCLIAEGLVDLYPRLGEISEWDVAAGHAVLVAAGGGVCDVHGAPLTYGHAARKFAVDGLVAFGGAAASAEARRALALISHGA